MRQLSLTLLFTILIVTFCNICNSGTDNPYNDDKQRKTYNQSTSKDYENKIKELIQLTNKLQFDQKLTKEALQEIRQGQVNYSIEKNLLKETYSSNTERINIIIMITLGFLSIIGFSIGFLGLKSIGSIKNEFKSELNKLNEIRSSYEQKFANIEKEQKTNIDNFEKMQRVNKINEKRLHVIEIIEQIRTHLKNKKYSEAMKCVEEGLKLNPKEIYFLFTKAICAKALFDSHEAIKCYEELLKVEPNSKAAIGNLIETYLLVKDIPKADKLINEHKQFILNIGSGFLNWYFDLVKLYLSGNLNALKKHVDSKIIQTAEGYNRRIKEWEWGFDDVRKGFEKDSDSPLKSLLFASIEFLEGKIDVSDLNKIKSEIEETS